MYFRYTIRNSSSL